MINSSKYLQISVKLIILYIKISKQYCQMNPSQMHWQEYNQSLNKGVLTAFKTLASFSQICHSP